MKNVRELVNGARVLPQGYKLDERFPIFAEASTHALNLNRQAKKAGVKTEYNVSGVAGNYCILAYTGNLVTDRRYN